MHTRLNPLLTMPKRSEYDGHGHNLSKVILARIASFQVMHIPGIKRYSR